MPHSEYWIKLTPHQRVLHYNRNLPHNCDHKANLDEWPIDLREPFSFDPYAHIDHTIIQTIMTPTIDK